MTDGGSWFAEAPEAGFQQAYEVRAELYRGRSPLQEIVVLDTVPFGRALVLDGALQTTERDEYAYHEMLAHVPLFAHPDPRRVLIVGGGDGGLLRRVLEHPVELAVQVEIDQAVVEVSRTYLPSVSAGAFDDPRVRLVIGDGVRYLAETSERFDVILVDSTDPVGPAVALFGGEFFRSAGRALRERGIFVIQSGSPLLQTAQLRSAVDQLRTAFPIVRPYLGMVPAYPGILWSFTAASAGTDPARADPVAIAARMARVGMRTRYYTPDVHGAAFALPAFLARLLEDPRADGQDAPVASVSE